MQAGGHLDPCRLTLAAASQIGDFQELALPFNDRATQWVGSRPTLPDYLPAIGQSRKKRNVFYAFGHQHLGLTLAALTGELMAALMTEKAPVVDLKPFDVERFAW